MLDDGKIGTIQAIYASGKQDHRGGGEDMIVLGTHLFNMMRFFVGDVAWMQSHVTANGKEIAYGDDHKRRNLSALSLATVSTVISLSKAGSQASLRLGGIRLAPADTVWKSSAATVFSRSAVMSQIDS